jgi:hypothetical protein
VDGSLIEYSDTGVVGRIGFVAPGQNLLQKRSSTITEGIQ